MSIADQEIETPENTPEKKYIEVSTEDYELALAGKVIQRSYKLVFGVIIVIVGLLTFLGIKYNVNINQAQEELSTAKSELKDLKRDYEKLASSIQNDINQLAKENQSADKYYETISNSFGTSSGAIFSSFVSASRENLVRLNVIEQGLHEEIRNAQEETRKIQEEIVLARSELKTNESLLADIKTLSVGARNQEAAIKTLIDGFADKFNAEPLKVTIDGTVFSRLLQLNIKYESATRRNRDRKIHIGNDAFYFNQVPPSYTTINGSKYNLEILGEDDNDTIIVNITKIS